MEDWKSCLLKNLFFQNNKYSSKIRNMYEELLHSMLWTGVSSQNVEKVARIVVLVEKLASIYMTRLVTKGATL